MITLTNLRKLHEDMKKKNEYRAEFPITFNERDFSCIYITDTKPHRLYLTTLGRDPFVFEFSVFPGYRVKSYVDQYAELTSCLNIKYDPNHQFTPEDFFDTLNRLIPTKFTKRPDYKYVLRVASYKRDIEEADKVYFWGWRVNRSGNVSSENLEKTRSAFGEDMAECCNEKNISSRWIDVAEKEDLSKLSELNEFISF